ncbi:hypothetical protein ACFYYS_00380 [Streptomyces sp. NPDC002120]|uniref:hypothetical protein n=1 Tax=Streptomyces sp. NPDC002120 TaxID=3364631 RepID=UPI0036BE48C8
MFGKALAALVLGLTVFITGLYLHIEGQEQAGQESAVVEQAAYTPEPSRTPEGPPAPSPTTSPSETPRVPAETPKPQAPESVRVPAPSKEEPAKVRKATPKTKTYTVCHDTYLHGQPYGKECSVYTV